MYYVIGTMCKVIYVNINIINIKMCLAVKVFLEVGTRKIIP